MPPRLAVLILAVTVLAGCGGAASSPGPGIAPRPPVLPEERSTCEALRRADLVLIATDPASLRHSASALEDAADRGPAELADAARALAAAYRKAVTAPEALVDLSEDRAAAVVLEWLDAHCGGQR